MKYNKYFLLAFLTCNVALFQQSNPLHKVNAAQVEQTNYVDTTYYESIFVDGHEMEKNQLTLEQYNHNKFSESEERQEFHTRVINEPIVSHDLNFEEELYVINSEIPGDLGGPALQSTGNDYYKQVTFSPNTGYTITSAKYQYNNGYWFDFNNGKFFQIPGNYLIQVIENYDRISTIQFTIEAMIDIGIDGPYYTIPNTELGLVEVSLTSTYERAYSTHTLYLSYESSGRYMDVQQKLTWDVVPSQRGGNDIMFLGWTNSELQLEAMFLNNQYIVGASSFATQYYHYSDNLMQIEYDGIEQSEVPFGVPVQISDNNPYFDFSGICIAPYLPYDDYFEFMGFYQWKQYTKLEYYMAVRLETTLTTTTIDELTQAQIIANYLHATTRKTFSLSASFSLNLGFQVPLSDPFSLGVSITGVTGLETIFDSGRPLHFIIDYVSS